MDRTGRLETCGCSRFLPLRLGAEDRGRTGTRLPSLVFETSASAYSATSAQVPSISAGSPCSADRGQHGGGVVGEQRIHAKRLEPAAFARIVHGVAHHMQAGTVRFLN